MSNICGRLCIFKRKEAAPGKHRKTMRVERQDGKTLEFTAPILVKELLQHFPGATIALSNKSRHHLPPAYQLQLGKVYYLLPSPPSQAPTPTGESTVINEDEASSGIKRIKVVITRQQLQQLLSQQASVQDVLMVQDGETHNPGNPLNYPCWRPELQSVPEGDE